MMQALYVAGACGAVRHHPPLLTHTTSTLRPEQSLEMFDQDEHISLTKYLPHNFKIGALWRCGVAACFEWLSSGLQATHIVVIEPGPDMFLSLRGSQIQRLDQKHGA